MISGLSLADLVALEQMSDAELQALGPSVAPSVDDTADLLAIDSLAAFVTQAWHLVEPRYPLEWAPYFAIICRELEAVERGEVHDLTICLPPGVSKSIIVSVLFPAWLWLRRPELRVLTVSNADKLSTRDSRRTRIVLRSAWYQRLVARTGRMDIEGNALWTMTKDQDEKVNFVNTAGGAREAVGITSTNTGVRVDGLIIDDAHDASEANGSASEVAQRMESVVERYDTVLSNRTDAVVGWRIVVGQRLAEGDLPGVTIRRGARAVVLPMEGDPDAPNRHPLDERAAGELLHHRFVEWNAKNKAKGSRYYAAQFAQQPIAQTGSTFKREQIRWYSTPPERIAVDMVGITVDCAFKGEAESDRVSIQAWGKHGLDRYLLDCDTRNMDVLETMRALVAMYNRWARLHTIGVVLVEDKANGPAIITLLRQHVPKLVPFSPKDSKQARAQLAAVDFEAGHAYLPANAPWIGDYERELLAFPLGHDDQVDATSQLFLYWGQPEATIEDRLKAQAAALQSLPRIPQVARRR